jgi:hypothetical protein
MDAATMQTPQTVNTDWASLESRESALHPSTFRIRQEAQATPCRSKSYIYYRTSSYIPPAKIAIIKLGYAAVRALLLGEHSTNMRKLVRCIIERFETSAHGCLSPVPIR